MIASNTDEPAPENSLAIIFEDAEFLYCKDALYMTIRFVDSNTKQELPRVTVNRNAWRGDSWSGYAFENRVYNSVRNIAFFIKEKMMKL